MFAHSGTESIRRCCLVAAVMLHGCACYRGEVCCP